MHSTKQSHSDNPIATIPYRKGEIVLVIDGIYQGEEVEIFDSEIIYGKIYFWVIIGGCLSERIPLEFLSKKCEDHGKTDKKPDLQGKIQSKSRNKQEKGEKKQRRASK